MVSTGACRAVGRRDADMLRPHAQRDGVAGAAAPTVDRDGERRQARHLDQHAGAVGPATVPSRKFIRGRADEAGDEAVGRPVVEVERCADLLDMAAAQHHDLVGHGHGLDLVVRHIDHGVAEPVVQVGELDPHLHPQLGIEVRERLVEQEDLGLADDRPADRDPLPLPARELPRPRAEQRLDLQHPRRLGHAPLDLGAARADVLEPEGQVLPHGHMRVERVGLEHHGEPALGRAQLVDALAVDPDLAAGDVLQPGDHPEQRRLPAARRADEDAELAVLDAQVDAVDHLGVAVALDRLSSSSVAMLT